MPGVSGESTPESPAQPDTPGFPHRSLRPGRCSPKNPASIRQDSDSGFWELSHLTSTTQNPQTGVSGVFTPDSPALTCRSLCQIDAGVSGLQSQGSHISRAPLHCCKLGRLVYKVCARHDFPLPSKDIPLLIVRISYTQTQRKSLRKSFISSSVFSLLRGR